MKIVRYTDEESREAAMLENTAAGLRFRKDTIRLNGVKELFFQDPAEVVAEEALEAAKELEEDNGLMELIEALEAEGVSIKARLPKNIQDRMDRRAELKALLAN